MKLLEKFEYSVSQSLRTLEKEGGQGAGDAVCCAK